MTSCLTTFIERSIIASNISGVDTLRSTGQLIPFVIGICSKLLALREGFMALVRKVRPNDDTEIILVAKPSLQHTKDWPPCSLKIKLGYSGDALEIVNASDNDTYDDDDGGRAMRVWAYSN